MDNNMSNKPTYNNNGGQQATAANNNNKGIINISKPALIGGAIGCVGVGVGLGVAGTKIFGAIKTKRAEKAANKKADKSDKKE